VRNRGDPRGACSGRCDLVGGWEFPVGADDATCAPQVESVELAVAF
jgi:hypothetical protein